MSIISFGSVEIPKTVREGKGKSKIAFPDTYCVVDTETTGLSPEYDWIIEIGAIRYVNGQEVDRFQSLVKPFESQDDHYVDGFITDLTGITNAMLADAPLAEIVVREFAEFLGDDTIIGYNVNFDINFLYDAFVKHVGRPLTNDYIDIMRFSRKLYREMPRHRLRDMVERYGIVNEHSHRALSDVEATETCYERMHEDAVALYGSEEAFIKAFDRRNGGSIYGGVRAVDVVGDETKNDPDSPLYQKRCVFTGTLEKFTRKEAMQIVADLGGINQDSVTKKTNYLVLGNNDYCASIKDGKSRKQKKAEEYKIAGYDIEIVPETVFYNMIGEAEEDVPGGPPAELTAVSWKERVSNMLEQLIADMELPEGSIYLSENKSQKNRMKRISYSVCIWEPDYPPISSMKKPGQNRIVLTIAPSAVKSRPDDLILILRDVQEGDLHRYLPSDAEVLIQTNSDKTAGKVKVRFDRNSDSLLEYIRKNTEYCVRGYMSKANSFGCCSSFEKCSDAKRCVHENKLYATACMYRGNLAQGRIFYGQNRNID